MKICPKCHTQYEDTMSFCLKDGAQLVTETTAPATDPSVETNKSEPPKPQPKASRFRGCLKRLFITALVLILVAVGIYSYIIDAATYLRVEPNQIVATKGGGECMVDLDYDGYVWHINHKPNWVVIDKYKRAFNIKVNPNATGQPRQGSITLQSGDHLAQVVIAQNHQATMINPSETRLSFDRDGGTETVFVQTDGCYWDAQYTDWMTVKKENSTTLRVTCPANRGNYRTGVIKIYEDNVYTVVNVTQVGNCPTCGGAGEFNCNVCGGTGQANYGFYYGKCYACGGNGKYQCNTCKGGGYIK